MIKPFIGLIVTDKERKANMVNEEKILHDKLGNTNHFKVPEGYFEHFTEQLMSQIPAEEAKVIEMQPRWWKRISVRKVAAAVAVVLLLGGGGLYWAHLGSRNSNAITVSQNASVQEGNASSASYGTFEEVADYAMIDNQDIYTSLMAEN